MSLTTLSQDTQDFLTSPDLPMRKELAENIIAQMGGEEYFVKRYVKVNRFGASTGFKGISSASDVLSFFDTNRAALYDLMGVLGAKHCIGEVEYIKEVINKKEFTMQRVREGLTESVGAYGEHITDCSDERMMVAHWSVWHAVDLLCSAYNEHVIAKKQE